MSVQTCVRCNNTKHIMEFNIYHVKTGIRRYSYCKNCHNLNRVYHKKTTGFQKLPEAQRRSIALDLASRLTLKEIASKYNVKYPTLVYWNRTKQILL